MNENTEWQDHAASSEESRQENLENTREHRTRTDANEEGRPRRPRIGTYRNDYDPRGGYERRENNGYQRGGYDRQRESGYQHSSYGQQREGGYQRSGYGQQREGGYQRSGYGQQREGGYQRSNYGQQREGGYQRSNYGQQREGGYQRSGYGQQREGSYQRSGYGQQREGGYQRSSYGQQREGGYRRYNYGQQREGGYERNSYGRQREGGYQRGYQPRGHNQDAGFAHKKRIEYQEYIEDPNAPIRLNKYLANAGVCSRREADQFIQAGVVKVNGEVVTELGTKVQRTDTIHFHDQLVSLEKKVYVLLNKPKDYVTTSDDPQNRKTVLELVKNACSERIYPVGRLDRGTMGVLLFTNDGELASKLTHPKYLKRKIYHVFLDKNLTAADMKQIAEGVTLEDGPIRADDISYASETDRKQVGIEIHSGKNRIVRRIFEKLGYRVLKLDRVMFAGLTKKGLKRGDWRFLTEQEVAMLHMGGGAIEASDTPSQTSSSDGE